MHRKSSTKDEYGSAFSQVLRLLTTGIYFLSNAHHIAGILESLKTKYKLKGKGRKEEFRMNQMFLN